MVYTLSAIKKRYGQKKLKYIFFWGHTPSGDGTLTNSCFSQWWPCCFELDGQQYNSAEQFMMAEKAALFCDEETREKILRSNYPKQAKDLGRQVRYFNETLWVTHRYEIVKRGNFAKFSQNHDLCRFLLQTNDRILVEASPVDKVWGIGMDVSNDHIENPLKWKGLNLLGFALMEVRDELKRTT